MCYSIKLLISSLLYAVCINSSLYAQSESNDYFENYSLKINNATSKNEFVKLGLYNYQVFFFGENHESEKVSYKEIYFINILRDEIKYIFVEFPIGYYGPYKEFMKGSPIDTLTSDFKFYSGQNKSQEILLRYLYRENTARADSLKYEFLPIDIITTDQVKIDDVLWFFKGKIKRKQVKKGLHILQRIKADGVNNKDSLLSRYLLFREIFYANLPTYKSYLKKNFNEMKRDIDGIYAYSLASKEDTVCACRANSREEFMLKNIMEEDVKKFISINGVSHVPLTIQKDWEDMEEWNSLASRFKKLNSDINVCSIYFMERESDNFDNKYFPQEKKIILENTEPGETYLIRLDGENTPFKGLSEKFQYIVVW